MNKSSLYFIGRFDSNSVHALVKRNDASVREYPYPAFLSLPNTEFGTTLFLSIRLGNLAACFNF